MKENTNKLVLSQETLRNLTENNDKTNNFKFTHTCRSVCGLPCTPVAGIN